LICRHAITAEQILISCYRQLGDERADGTEGDSVTYSVSQDFAHLCPHSGYRLSFHHRFVGSGDQLACAVDMTLGSASVFHYDFPVSQVSGDGFMFYNASGLVMPIEQIETFEIAVSCTRYATGEATFYINVDDISFVAE